MARRINPRLAPFYAAPKNAPCLYAIELSNGLVKVGKATYPQERLAEHARVHGLRNIRLVRFEVARIVNENAWRAERQLLARMDRIGRRIAPKYETFMGVRFGAAANLVRQIASREFVEYVPLRSCQSDSVLIHPLQSAFFSTQSKVNLGQMIGGRL